jgi:hypothetical protein
VYQNTTLIQNLNDSKLAERRRGSDGRRTAQARRNAPPRITRPLARFRSH